MKGSEIMKKKVIINTLLFIFLALLFVTSYSYAIYNGYTQVNGNIASADWNVTLNQTGVNNYLSVMANGGTATYDLNIVSNSTVDVVYSIVLSNVPEGVSVKLDNAENYTEQAVKTAFGKNSNPSWEDLELFLEERCIPRQRAGLRAGMR